MSARTASMSIGSSRLRAERSMRCEVVVDGERPPVVQAHDLEHAVAAEQPLVGGRDLHLVGGEDGAVEDSEHGPRLTEHGAPGWPGAGERPPGDNGAPARSPRGRPVARRRRGGGISRW